MRAFVLDGYGAIADHVRLAEIADPVPGPDDVLIEIHAASLNPIDFKIAHGDLKRVSKYQLPRPFGFDAAGVVLSAGAPACRSSSRAMRSMRAPRARRSARLPSRSRCRKNLVALKPATISHAEAAALPLVGLTTLQGCSRASRREAGQRILIHAGAGGIGTFAVQYARHLGLRRDDDDEFEECRFRQIARAPTGSSPMTARTISSGWRLRYRLRHARWRIHRRCLQGGEARRRGDLAERAAGSRFRPARGRGPGWSASPSG